MSKLLATFILEMLRNDTEPAPSAFRFAPGFPFAERPVAFATGLLLTFLLASSAQAAFAVVDRFDSNSLTAVSRTTSSQIQYKGTYKKIYDYKLKRHRLVKDTFLIKFKQGAGPVAIDNYVYANNLEIVSHLGKNIFECKILDNPNSELSSDERFTKVVNRIHRRSTVSSKDADIVEAVDVNEYRKINLNDIESNPDGYKQWHLHNDGVNGFKVGADINVESAWQYTRGAGVKVAVIDTGFDVKHRDINYATVGFNALDDVSEDTSLVSASAPKDSFENHGTAVAGVIAAVDNKIGVIGVAPEAEIVPIRLISDSGEVSVAQIVRAFRKADELGAKIINNSWGTSDPSLPEGEVLEITDIEKELYEDIAKNGNNGKGILLIFASGNSGDKDFNNSPEARLPCTMAVGATDSADQRASYSVYGPELDIVAPGGGAQPIYTTDRNDLRLKSSTGQSKRIIRGYSKGSVANGFRGTSAAAPMVSGVAALIWSLDPNLTADQVRGILTKTANKNINPKYEIDQSGKNSQIGYGRVDAGAAIEYMTNP
jgi:subtilisin family serine protease